MLISKLSWGQSDQSNFLFYFWMDGWMDGFVDAASSSLKRRGTRGHSGSLSAHTSKATKHMGVQTW